MKKCLIGLAAAALILGGCSGRRDVLFEVDSHASETEPASEAVSEPAALTALTESQVREESLPVSSQMPEEDIYIDVSGAVMRPGVYRLRPGSRIWQALEAAGGLTADAAGSYLNQAAVLQDGQQIYVPAVWEAASGGALPSASGGLVSSQAASPAGFGRSVSTGGDVYGEPVPEGTDLYTAAAVPLEDSSGKVDLNKADAEQLTKVSGIGPAKAKAILEYRDQSGPFSCIEDIMKVPGIKEGTFEKIRDEICVTAP